MIHVRLKLDVCLLVHRAKGLLLVYWSFCVSSREVKVQVSRGGMSYTIMNQLIKKKQGPMSQLMCTLKLKKVTSLVYVCMLHILFTCTDPSARNLDRQMACVGDDLYLLKICVLM